MKNLKQVSVIALSYLFVTTIIFPSISFAERGMDEEQEATSISIWSPESVVTKEAPKQETTRQQTPKLPEAPTVEILNTLNDQAAEELEQVERLIGKQEYGAALLQAKKVLDKVSRKAGIDPRVKSHENIFVSNIISNRDLKTPYNTNLSSLEDGEVFAKGLKNRQKEEIAKAIRDHKRGYYLDLLNHAKRASVMYLKALYFNLKNNSPDQKLRKRDILHFKDSLLSIHSIAIYIQDEKTKDSYMLFDVDVVNPTQNYLFNRELMDFALELAELEITEEKFEQMLLEEMASKLKKHWAGLRSFQEEYGKCFAELYSQKQGYTIIHEHEARELCKMDPEMRTCYLKHLNKKGAGNHYYNNWPSTTEICNNGSLE